MAVNTKRLPLTSSCLYESRAVLRLRINAKFQRCLFNTVETPNYVTTLDESTNAVEFT